jgi:hypothetical protein
MKFTGRPRRMTDAEICRMYAECQDSLTVACHAQCSSTTVLTIARRNGIVIPKRGGRRIPLDATDAEICRRYLGGQSGVSLAQELGTHPVTIYGILERHGVERREKWRHLRKPKPKTLG